MCVYIYLYICTYIFGVRGYHSEGDPAQAPVRLLVIPRLQRPLSSQEGKIHLMSNARFGTGLYPMRDLTRGYIPRLQLSSQEGKIQNVSRTLPYIQMKYPELKKFGIPLGHQYGFWLPPRTLNPEPCTLNPEP